MHSIDRFIPYPDIRERFDVTVRAPAALVMDVAANFDMQSILAVRLIIRCREWLLGAKPTPREPQGLLEETRRLGWGVLAEEPGRWRQRRSPGRSPASPRRPVPSRPTSTLAGNSSVTGDGRASVSSRSAC